MPRNFLIERPLLGSISGPLVHTEANQIFGFRWRKAGRN